MQFIILAALFGVVFRTVPAIAQTCGSHKVAVQVLGSGGPFPAGATASSGYIVRRDGRSIVLTVVFGGDQNGSNPRFVEFATGADALVMHLAISTKPLAGDPTVRCTRPTTDRP